MSRAGFASPQSLLSARVVLACTALVFCAACGDLDGGDVRSVARSAWQAMSGAPSEASLCERRTFEGAGVRFDHPAPLVVERDHDAGDDVWTLGHGLYTLELHAAGYLSGAREYLALLGAQYGNDGTTKLLQPVAAHRELTLCGHAVRSVRMRVSLLGDETTYEGFDLPPHADGRVRILVVSDEPVGGRPSRVAAAAERMLLQSLRCDGAGEGAGGPASEAMTRDR